VSSGSRRWASRKATTEIVENATSEKKIDFDERIIVGATLIQHFTSLSSGCP
jgi:hypothetical protein